jgi:hypothetical protein
MSTRNLAWLRKELSKLLNFDATSPDAAFLYTAGEPWGLIDGFAQEAYEAIVSDVLTMVGHSELFRRSVDLVWPASTPSLTLPSWLDYTSIHEIRDVTSSEDGYVEIVRPQGPTNTSSLWWSGPGKLQMSGSGPGSDKTLRIWYLQAEELNSELSEPVLIPHRFRMLWKWSSAILARRYKDEDNIPNIWLQQEDEWKRRFHHSISQGSPSSPFGSVVEHMDSDVFY